MTAWNGSGRQTGAPQVPADRGTGWIEQIHPMDDIVEWDDAGIGAGDFTRDSPIRRIDDRNAPDPAKRLPGDPFGPHTTS